MNNGSQKINCNIIGDLLPLYHDGVVSEETSNMVAEHLAECEQCKKEYDVLCDDLPITEGDVNTKNRFIGMMRGQKRKRMLITITSIVIACVLLTGAFFTLFYIPLDTLQEEVTVHRVYRYETEKGNKFFVFYSVPSYYNFKVEMGYDADTVTIDIKKPLLTPKGEHMNEDFLILACGSESSDNGVLFHDYESVVFSDKVVWSEEQNKNDNIPAYVYAYEDFNSMNGDIVGWTWDTYDGEMYVEAHYRDGRIVRWNLEGKVLLDSNMSGD